MISPLVLVHIPKTAGTTLHKILTHQFPPPAIAIHHDSAGPPSDELIERMSGSRPSVRLVLGHVSAIFHPRLPAIRYLTCLRDPLGRVRSHHQYARRDPTHYLHEAAQDLSLAEYVRSGLSGELSNGMVRMLAGMEDFHHGEVNQAVFDRALDVLENRMAGVLLTSDFDETLLDAAGNLGWKTPFYLRRKVGSYAKTPMDPTDREAVEEMNAFDLELYRKACRRWDDRRACLPSGFDRELRVFRRRNRSVGRGIFLAREACRRAGFQAPF